MDDHRTRMKAIFDRLFKEHAPPGGEGAFECALNFRSGMQVQGVIGRAEVVSDDGVSHDALKLATPAMKAHPEHGNNPRYAQKVMLEHYFDYGDIESVVVMRQVDASKIAGDGRPSIILGG